MKTIAAIAIAIILLLSSASASQDVSAMTREERDSMMLKILQANADEDRGASDELRGYSTISFDTPVLLHQTAYFGIKKTQYDLWITLKDISYGSKALQTIQGLSKYSSEPEEDEQYIIVTLYVSTKGGTTETIKLNENDFEFISRSKSIYKNTSFVVGLNDEIELFDEGFDELRIAHIIKKGDIPFLRCYGSIWFDLTPDE